MSAMDCAAFEAALASALASPHPADDGAVAALRRHVAACPSCRGSAALVDLAAGAAEDRDPIPDPGPAYWSEFDRRLTTRLRSERPVRSRRRALAWLGATAALAAAVAAVAFIAHPGKTPAPPGPTPTTAIAGGSGSTTDVPASGLDTGAGAEDEGDEALGWGSLSDPLALGDEPGLFPEASGLSEAERDRFAAWLAEETRRVKGGSA